MTALVQAGRRQEAIRRLVLPIGVLLCVAGMVLLTATQAHGATLPSHGPVAPATPAAPTAPATPAAGSGSGGPTVSINGINGTPASTIVTLLGVTLLAVAPGLLIMVSSFTKVFVVLSMARNALGLQSIPPNQVLAGLSLFLTLFIMGPTIGHINTDAIQPYLSGHIGFGPAVQAAEAPLKTFLGAHTRQADVALITRAAGRANPANMAAVPLTTLIPAFVISELRSAFIIGFVIYIPFLVIDLVVSAGLMSLGMMMLPPVMVSLPFKILLFVLVDGWGLIIQSLVASYR
ncbi:flagellar type III secretion system pore protein FliP [Curtobacterium ammoniigenes]|uniref:flagellar type III secretion system pore protein FliP n=1 Tax=Curtobacterium ammoniigenes TaxID=395387 RepID=UPI000834F5E9|nr:flagellar type III secretion system pore protein FliP [Curtobacterium ammoniigenes]